MLDRLSQIQREEIGPWFGQQEKKTEKQHTEERKAFVNSAQFEAFERQRRLREEARK